MRIIIEKLKAFWHVFSNSIIKPSYYNELLKTPIKFTFKYYFLLGTILISIVATSTTIQFSPKAQKTIVESIEKAVSMYPKDLVITAKSGSLNINQQEPYFLKAPEEFNNIESEYEIENIVVFDKKGTVGDFMNYKTLALVNEKNILIKGVDKMEVYPVKNMPDGAIDYDYILHWSNIISESVKYVPYLVFVVSIIVYGGYYFIGRLIYTLFVSIVFVIRGSIGGKKKSFSDYYRIGLHTMTLPLIIEVLFILMQVPIGVLFWFLIVHTTFGLFVIGKLKNNQ